MREIQVHGQKWMASHPPPGNIQWPWDQVLSGLGKGPSKGCKQAWAAGPIIPIAAFRRVPRRQPGPDRSPKLPPSGPRTSAKQASYSDPAPRFPDFAAGIPTVSPAGWPIGLPKEQDATSA
jgi:hypothetical protein